MKNFVLATFVLTFAAAYTLSPSAFADNKAVLTCVPGNDGHYNDVFKKVSFFESDLKGRYEVEIVRFTGETEHSGITEADFSAAKTSGYASTTLSLPAGRDRSLKRTGAYDNLEVLAFVRSQGKLFLSQGRTCDPYYQEEEGCDFDRDILDIRFFALDCK